MPKLVINHQAWVSVLIGVMLVASCVRSPASPPSSATLPPPTLAATPAGTPTPPLASPVQTRLIPTPSSPAPPRTAIPVISPTPTSLPITPLVWNVYDKDPNHLWNRLFRALYGRTALNGQEYGRDELDPLLWQDTSYLIQGPSHQVALDTLDEFLRTHGEQLITDPLRRAMLQRDLWAIFDWLTFQASNDLDLRGELEQRLAQAIQRLALSRQQIEALPNNYEAAVHSGEFPTEFQTDRPQTAFIPAGMFVAGSDWINLGRQGGPIAMTHLQELPFLGRSACLVFVRVPGGRGPDLAYLNALQTKAIPPFIMRGTEVALVRRMLLIDNQGEIVASPLIESVQLRHFDQTGAQISYELILNRDRLFASEAGGLRSVAPDETDFSLFVSQGDVFGFPDPARDVPSAPIVATCQGCHEDLTGAITGSVSILSYSRARFPLPAGQSPVLFVTTPKQESETTIEWKRAQPSWQQMHGSWPKP